MTNISDSPVNQQNYLDNLQLSYDYLEKSIKEIQDVINNTNSQLGILIGFNFTFIRFFLNELPTAIITTEIIYFNVYFWLKIAAYILAIASIIISLIGLYQNTELTIIKPNILLESCSKVANNELKRAIMDVLEQKLQDFKILAQRKKNFFNFSIFLLLGSGLLSLVNEAIATRF